MTTKELTDKFNDEFGVSGPWPKEFKIDLETYKNVLLSVFNARLPFEVNGRVTMSIGFKGGLMFKNVELILESE